LKRIQQFCHFFVVAFEVALMMTHRNRFFPKTLSAEELLVDSEVGAPRETEDASLTNKSGGEAEPPS
jgi:hypothetical protein